MSQPLQNLTYNEQKRSHQAKMEADDMEETRQRWEKENRINENAQHLLRSQYAVPTASSGEPSQYVSLDTRLSRLRHNDPPIARSMSAPKAAKLQREYSPEREADYVTSEVWKELKSAMKRQDKHEKAYVCDDDIRKIWKKQARISILIRSSGPSAEQITFIQEHMIIILSTLVWIGDSKCLNQFKSRFFEPMTSCKALITDKDMPLIDDKSKLGFISSEPLKEQFHKDQFIFTPVRINIDQNYQSTQKIDPRQRLPFEEVTKGVGSGGFGKVDRVSISPKYCNISGAGEAEMSTNKVFVVACKKIKLQEDFDKERENLQILKESLTTHKRIMLHFTTIEHGLSRYIMLPYAQYGDLEVFLHEGHASKKVKKYEFDHVFNQLGERDSIVPLLAECLVLADALRWLHSQISIERTSDKVFCAHMDLKPANILIHPPDAKNPVGKWMISDFGISVFREDTEQHDPEYGSIGDYISQVTMNTRPKRQEGTYQAPEIKIAEKFKRAPHLTPDQQGIGRKSDVWSFGCILSEILAFSQGRAEMVKEFSDTRKKQNFKDDYFYSELSTIGGQYLATGAQIQKFPKSFEVRPTVITWLDKLCERVAHPQKWMYCYVSTIKKILVVDTKERPNAKQLLILLQHVQYHIRHSLLGTSLSCQTLGTKGNLEPIIPIEEEAIEAVKVPKSQRFSFNNQASKDESGSSTYRQHGDDAALSAQVFRFTRQDTIGIELIDTVKHKTPQHIESVREIELESSVIDDTDSSTLLEARPSSVTEDLIRPDPVLIQPVQSQDTMSDISSHFASLAKPAHAHGIIIDQYPPPVVHASTRVSLPQPASGNTDIIAMSLTKSTNGPRLACLSKSSVIIYTLKPRDFKVILEPPIPLIASEKWKDLSIAGNFLVVWGYDSKRLIHFCDTTTRQSRSFTAEETGILQKATVSAQGVVALYDQNFTHAAFNDTGDLLFAWAYGQVDKLYCWRCTNGMLNRATDSESPYETAKGGKPDLIKVIPYNSYQGCIVEKPDKKLFPAQIRSTLRNNYTPFSRNETQIPDLHAACVFNDFSLITVEKGMLHRRLKEYQIDYKGTHILVTPATQIGEKFSSSTDENSKVLAVKDGGSVVIVICNRNATVEFIKVVPS